MNDIRRASLFPGLFLAVLIPALLATTPARADVRLPQILGSDMVLQSGVPVPIWGWAEPGEKVTVRLLDAERTATADAQSQWKVEFPALSTGGPHKLSVSGKNTIELSNILAGEVWLGAGQSNMEMGVGGCQDGPREIAEAKYPQIRLFMVENRTSGYPEDDVAGTWRVCSPETLGAGGWSGFSAAAYYFGREVHKTLNVPVGLIDSSWGGTRIEPWTPPEGFASVPALADISARIDGANAEHRRASSAALDHIERAVAFARTEIAQGRRVPSVPSLPRHALDQEQQPTGLYNAMIHGLLPFPIRGALWYQGESNVGEGMLYFEKMKALIQGWRKVWGNDRMAFYFVALAPFRYGSNPRLPEIWEAQAATLSLPLTGMAVITDITTLGDIHPPNKQDVGRRLALWALVQLYGKKDIVYSGPLYDTMAVEGDKIRIHFRHVAGGLESRDGKDLTWFEIAGADKAYVPARATIDGDSILVSSEALKAPVAVRFGWSEVAEPNLQNKEKLPAAPFRTDRTP
jgi:sialate O-acetylesterase